MRFVQGGIPIAIDPSGRVVDGPGRLRQALEYVRYGPAQQLLSLPEPLRRHIGTAEGQSAVVDNSWLPFAQSPRRAHERPLLPLDLPVVEAPVGAKGTDPNRGEQLTSL